MFLKCLYLSEDSFVAFEKGLNIILAENRKHESDEEERTSDTNGVGKSTIVNMIKFLLCGSTENYLDSNFFTDNNIWPILEVRAKGEPFVFAAPLSKSLKDKLYIVFEGTLEEFLEKWKRVDLGVIEKPKDAKDLFEGVESFSVLSKEEYKSYLSRIEKVNYADTNLKLSSLMDYVCRDEKLGFGDIVSRIGRTMWIQYRAIQYLFGLPYVLEEKSNNFREEISKIETNLKLKKEFLAERGIVNQDSLEVEKVKLNQQLEELKNQISSLDLTESNELTRKEYQKKKKELVRLNEEINYRERQMASQQANLEEIKAKENAVSKLLEAEKFLEDIVENFPDLLKKNIKAYDSFISELAADRKDYHRELIRKIKQNLKSLSKEKDDVESVLANYTNRLSNTDMIIDISRLTAREEKLKLQIEELKTAEKFLVECEVLEEDIDNKMSDWNELIKKGKQVQKRSSFRTFKTKLIKLFLFMVRKCYQANEGAIQFIFNDKIGSTTAGRTEIICSLSSDTSHGRTNAKICLFDFTWFLRPRSKDEYPCEFLIHDGPYAKISSIVKSRMLRMMDQLSRFCSKQYIITANGNEIPNMEKFKGKVRIRLDGADASGKFFGVQYE